MAERLADDRIVKESQTIIDRARKAVEMNQEHLSRLQTEHDERRERERAFEILLSPRPPRWQHSLRPTRLCQ